MIRDHVSAKIFWFLTSNCSRIHTTQPILQENFKLILYWPILSKKQGNVRAAKDAGPLMQITTRDVGTVNPDKISSEAMIMSE